MEQLFVQIGTPAIAVIVPILIFGIKKMIPKTPKAFLPVLAGVFGPAVEGLITWIGDQPFTGTTGVVMGFVGVGLRELKDQGMKALRGQSTPLKAAWPATIVATLLTLMLVGCSGITPETPRERLVVAEKTYDGLLATTSDYIDRGIITAENRDAVTAAIRGARQALDTWQLNPDSFDAMSAGLGALQAVQAILDSLAPAAGAGADPPLLLVPLARELEI